MAQIGLFLVFPFSHLDPYRQQQCGCDPSEIHLECHIEACFLKPCTMDDKIKNNETQAERMKITKLNSLMLRHLATMYYL